MNSIIMLVIYAAVVFMLSFPTEGGIIRSNGKNADQFHEFLHRRCSKNADMFDMQQHAEKLHVRELCIGIDSEFTDTNDDEMKIKRQCLAWTDKVEKCFNTTLDLVQPCFESKESYIPDFARKSGAAYLKYFCSDPKIFTASELLESNMAKCINRLAKHPETNPQTVCFETMKLLDSSDNNPITKKQLCHDLNNVYSCYERKYKEHCADSPKAWQFQQGLLNGLRSPCKE